MMHVMASFFGYATTVIPRIYTYYISSLLFAIFGVKMLHEGYHMSPNEGQEEFEEVGEELRKKEERRRKAPWNREDQGEQMLLRWDCSPKSSCSRSR